MRSKKIELLAPGGSMDGIRGAVNAGADAVYAGGRLFGARAFAENPETDLLLEAIDYCHLHGAKLFLTVNTLLKENELTNILPEYLAPIYEHGVDAVLVQDFGVFRFLREAFPNLPLHASTQMTVTGPDGVRLLQEMGAERIVLSRELSLEEIRIIRKQCDAELETFVHGALCCCYSGKCLMSSMIGGRSGNRGRCAQPCRLPYDLYDRIAETGRKQRDGQQLKSLNHPTQKYLLSPKDICTLRLLPDLIDAGIASLKIEGRMKSAEYAAGVTAMYRRYIDLYLEKGRDGYHVEERDEKLLLELFSRGAYSEGYYYTRNGSSMMVLEEKESGKGDALRNAQETVSQIRSKYVDVLRTIPLTAQVVICADSPAVMTVSDRNGHSFCAEGFVPSQAQSRPATREAVLKQISRTGNTDFTFESVEIQLEDGLFVPVRELNELRRRALEGIRKQILEPHRRELPSLAPRDRKESQTVESFFGRSVVGNEFGRPVVGNEFERSVVGNEFGRSVAGNIIGRSVNGDNSNRRIQAVSHPVFTASVCSTEQLDAVLQSERIGGIYLDVPVCTAENARLIRSRGKKAYLMLPEIWRVDTARTIKEWMKREFGSFSGEIRGELDGILVRSYDQLYALRTEGISDDRDGFEIVADASLYTWNSSARKMLSDLGVTTDTIPCECSMRELLDRGCAGSECIIYGYLPLMTSAQCLVKTTTGCRKKPGIRYLRDRKGIFFPVKNDCSICVNTIYNSVPLELVSLQKEVEALGAASYRYQFTVESGEETRRILEGRLPEKITRGHFRKGAQ